MGDEDEVRELIGRMSAAQRQGLHVTPAGIKIVLAALRFYLAARTWLAKPETEPSDEPRKQSEKYAGPPATIGDLRRSGLIACTIECAGPECWNTKRVAFDALALPDTVTFGDIPRLRRFRCQRCGSKRVRVSPDWTDHAAQGNGRRRASE